MHNILITGGCGFIGSNFINHYFHSECNIINIDAMYYSASESNVLEEISINKKYKLIKGSLCDTALVTNLLDEHNITHIIHFAAQSHVQNSFNDSLIIA